MDAGDDSTQSNNNQNSQTRTLHLSLDSKTGKTISVPQIPIFKAVGDLMLHKNAISHTHR